jgi:hypothetical protein
MRREQKEQGKGNTIDAIGNTGNYFSLNLTEIVYVVLTG